jgi:thioredoxin reductase (NADPH)
MAAALYAARARLRTLLLDRMPGGGGQLLSTDVIEDYPGIERITGQDLAIAFRTQIGRLDVHVKCCDVFAIEVRGDLRVVRDIDGIEHVGKTVIVATGGVPRKLGVSGEMEYAARGVSYCAICDGPFFRDKTLVVVGGGDSAIEEASFLTRYARQVYIVHRRGRWRAQRLLQERALANTKIHPIWNSSVEEIGGGTVVEWLRLKNLSTGEVTTLEANGVFIYVGYRPGSQVLGEGVSRDDQGFVNTDEKMETSISGVYVAGDVRRQYLRQISNAVGDATTAAVAATRYIEELDTAFLGGEAAACLPTAAAAISHCAAPDPIARKAASSAVRAFG